jgi:hypothetical protein
MVDRFLEFDADVREKKHKSRTPPLSQFGFELPQEEMKKFEYPKETKPAPKKKEFPKATGAQSLIEEERMAQLDELMRTE